MPGSVTKDSSGTKKTSLKQRIFLWTAANLSNIILRLLCKTVRIEIIGKEFFNQFHEKNEKFILAFWHGNMMIPLITHMDMGIYVLVSQHGDGEIIAVILKRLGNRLIRGSSTRGGSEALKEMLRKIKKENAGIAITPDGPKGPYRKMKTGAVVLAQRSDAPLIPMSAYTSSPKFLKSWDKFMFVKPFSKAVLIYGEPIYIERDLSEDEFEKQQNIVEERLKSLDEQAELYFKENR